MKSFKLDYFNDVVKGIFDRHAPYIKKVRGKPLDKLRHQGGFPFSAKCRAIDFYRALSFEMCEFNHS